MKVNIAVNDQRTIEPNIHNAVWRFLRNMLSWIIIFLLFSFTCKLLIRFDTDEKPVSIVD